MIKKNIFGYLRLLFLLSFTILFVTFSGNCKAYTTYNGRPQLNSGEFAEIIEEIGLNQYWSGDIVETARTSWNNWARNYSGDFILDNVAFFRGGSPNTEIGWFLSNGTYSNTLDFYALLPYNGQLSANNVPITSSTTALQIEGYTSWILDSSENRTGMNLFRPTGFYLNLSSANTVTTRSNSTIIVSGRNSNNESVTITINGITVYTPQLVTFNRYYTVASHTNSSGYEWFFLTHHLQFINESAPTPTPTPTPTPDGGGDSPGGGGGIDLSSINNKINDVKDAINQQGESIIAQLSGDTETIVSSIDDAFDSDTSNINSGDIELSTEDFEISAEQDPTSNFFTWLLEQIQDILTTDSVETLEFDFLDEHYILSSDFFTIDDGPLKTFLQAYFTFAVGLATALDIRRIIEQFKNGNIESIASDDINANIV